MFDSKMKLPRQGDKVRSLPARRKLRGQAAIIIVLASFALIAATGLAVDGGSMYAQRRNAQNAADAGALAVTRVMLDKYAVMILNYDVDIDGSAADEQDLKNVLASFADMHRVARANMKAYYVDDNKQLVVTAEVGSYGSIPWSMGTKGIMVKARSEVDAFFMKVWGWQKVGATASATAFMGPAQTDRYINAPLLPIGYFTYTNMLNNFNVGTTYRIFDHDVQTPGDFGYIDFNGDGDASVPVSIWMACGFNPGALTMDEWNTWCTTYPDEPMALGPTEHYTCGDTDCTIPSDDPIHVPYVKPGVGSDGWWIAGSSGNTNSVCSDFADMNHDRMYYIPIFDLWDYNGSNSRFHLARIGKFIITDDDIDCHPSSDEYIDGTFVSYVDNPTGGEHGSLRNVNSHTVFLDN